MCVFLKSQLPTEVVNVYLNTNNNIIFVCCLLIQTIKNLNGVAPTDSGSLFGNGTVS